MKKIAKRRSGTIDVTVGKRIRSLRQAGGYSKKVMAKTIGCSEVQFAKYEDGKNRLTVGHLLIMCGALGCSILDLVSDADIPATRSKP